MEVKGEKSDKLDVPLKRTKNKELNSIKSCTS